MLSEKPWTIERVAMTFVAMAAFLILFGTVQVATLKAAGLAKPDVNSLTYLVFLLLSPQSCVLAATAFVLWWCELGWLNAFGFSKWSVKRSLFWGTLVAIVFTPLGGLLKSASVIVFHFLTRRVPVEQEAIQVFEDTHNPVNRVFLVLFAVAMAPLAEEILFRGILYPAIKRLGYPKIALWGSAAVFAAIHASWPIFVPLVVLGVALALLYEHTDNLLASITAHAVFNAINLVVFSFSGGPPHAAQGWFHLFGS